MEQANKLYQQYLDDARNLAKVGKDELTLHKAAVFAQIAQAIAATGLVNEGAFGESMAPEPEIEKEESKTEPKKVVGTAKASLERKPEPKKVVGTAPKPEPKPELPAYLTSEEFKALKELEEENPDKHAERYKYLTGTYGNTAMRKLPEEAYAYFCPEKHAIDVFKYYLGQWKADVEQWTVKVATEASDGRATTIADLTVDEYLNKLMPAMLHLNYILSYAQDQAAMMDILKQVSRGQIKKLDDLRLRNIDFIHTAVDSVLNGTFDEIEKVS